MSKLSRASRVREMVTLAKNHLYDFYTVFQPVCVPPPAYVRLLLHSYGEMRIKDMWEGKFDREKGRIVKDFWEEEMKIKRGQRVNSRGRDTG